MVYLESFPFMGVYIYREVPLSIWGLNPSQPMGLVFIQNPPKENEGSKEAGSQIPSEKRSETSKLPLFVVRFLES